MQIEEFLSRLFALIQAFLQNPENLAFVEAGITAAENFLAADLAQNGAPVPSFGTPTPPSPPFTPAQGAGSQSQSMVDAVPMPAVSVDAAATPSNWLPKKMRGKLNSTATPVTKP